jgi:isocitrate dehydrogenase (NAD+)
VSGYQVVLLPGDGIGPEVARAACRVIEAVGVSIDWEQLPVGSAALEKYGEVLPRAVTDAARSTGLVLKGPVTTPVGGGFKSVNVSLRQELDLFANLRPIRSLPGVKSRYQEVDLVVIRENTEGLYIAEEIQESPDSISALKRVTRSASQRIAEFAFDFAASNHRKKVTIVHKANILKESDGLFLRTAQEVASKYPAVACGDRIVDALAMDLVVDPARHDVLLCPNLYGDVISDLAAGLIGGLGLVPGANIGSQVAIYEAVHGSAPDIAGQGIANPTALILAGEMLLRRLGERTAADRIRQALEKLYQEGIILTPDLGGKASTWEFTEALIEKIITSLS